MASSTPFQIIIVGGGIAGLSAAIALRAPGRQITILEQSRQNGEIGATISLQPNASRILSQHWNLSPSEQALARGMVDHGFRIYNTEGKMVNEIRLKGGKYGAERMMYHRQDLHACLKQAVLCPARQGPPAIIRTSCKVTSCDCVSGTVTLATGETLQAHLVVAADGIHSTIRTQVLGHSITPKPTGLSAYRMMVRTSELESSAPSFCAKVNPREPYTSMVMAHSCRLIMGPARDGELYSIVGLVPDEQMNEDPAANQSWVCRGDLKKLLDTYKDFPAWTKELFHLAKEIGLWQLRDIDPLPRWTRGRVILIGDAAHAMLPTQGQGASQTVEDAEALGALFENFRGPSDLSLLEETLQQVVRCRYDRVSLIQQYSRDAARPATEEGSKEVKMNPGEFMDYNCSYQGARDWQKKQAVQIKA